MKNSLIRGISLSLLVVGLIGCGGGKGEGKGKNNKENDNSEEIVNDAINAPLSTLTQELQDSIAYMYSEEKLAKEVYLNLYEVHAVKQLNNIATKSEVNHVDAVNRLAIKYDLNTADYPDTVAPYDAESLATYGNGEFPVEKIQVLYDMLYAKGIQSEQDALEVGCIVEVTDVEDLDGYLEQAQASNASDVVSIFEFLRNGSYNHYWAFDKGLKQIGVSNGCCSLGQTYCHPEYPQNEKGSW